MFGDNYAKATCLWLKGLERLVPDTIDEPEMEWYEFTTHTGKRKRQQLWYKQASWLPAEERRRIRSKTFPGIARAMAEQWGNGIRPQYNITKGGQMTFW